MPTIYYPSNTNPSFSNAIDKIISGIEEMNTFALYHLSEWLLSNIEKYIVINDIPVDENDNINKNFIDGRNILIDVVNEIEIFNNYIEKIEHHVDSSVLEEKIFNAKKNFQNKLINAYESFLDAKF